MPIKQQYTQPKSALGRFLWRRRMWFEATFVLSMLEPWEKLLVLSLFVFLGGFIFMSMYKYLPLHIEFLGRRAAFYFFGDEKRSWVTNDGSNMIKGEL